MSLSDTERQTNQSSMRLLQIMECLAKNRVPMKLQDIAKQVNMTQSTVLRYLYALEDSNYIYQDNDSARYALTWRVCRLSENLNSLLGLRNISNPFVNHLANSLSLGACVVIEKDKECLYVDCIDNPNSTTLQRIGKQSPMHTTGSGKIFLSQYSEEQLNDYIQTKGLVKYTDYTITDSESLRKELLKIREHGYGMDEQECEPGLRCISVPLRDYTRKVVAAMSVFGNVSDMKDQRIKEEIYPALKTAADTISTRLGYTAE